MGDHLATIDMGRKAGRGCWLSYFCIWNTPLNCYYFSHQSYPFAHLGLTSFCRITNLTIAKAHSAFNIAATHSSLLLYCTISLPVSHVTPIDTRCGHSQTAYNAAQRSLSSLVTVTHCREKFSDSTSFRSHWSRPHDIYSLQYLYWHILSTIKLFLKIELELEQLEQTSNDYAMF